MLYRYYLYIFFFIILKCSSIFYKALRAKANMCLKQGKLQGKKNNNITKKKDENDLKKYKRNVPYTSLENKI